MLGLVAGASAFVPSPIDRLGTHQQLNLLRAPTRNLRRYDERPQTNVQRGVEIR